MGGEEEDGCIDAAVGEEGEEEAADKVVGDIEVAEIDSGEEMGGGVAATGVVAGSIGKAVVVVLMAVVVVGMLKIEFAFSVREVVVVVVVVDADGEDVELTDKDEVEEVEDELGIC